MLQEEFFTTLPNGIQLFRTSMTKTIEKYAAYDWKIEGMRCFLAKEPSGYKTFILVKGETVIYESQSSESISAHIDMWALANNYKKV